MADFDLTDGLRKMFLAGVGVVATGAEKTQEVVENTSDNALRMRLSAMSAEERAAYAEKVAKMTAELDAEAVKVDVEETAEDADAAE